MSWSVTIGKWRLKLIESIKINKSVELLSDTATIVIPATVFNKALEVESKIQRGDKVNISFGYDKKLREEFSGYIESISTDGGSITINCEDDIFKFRTSIANKELKNADVNSILKYVCEEIKKQTKETYQISCDYDFKYDKFVINNATGYDVLKKIQEEAKPNVYMRDNVLHIHPLYSEIFGSARYDFARNIDAEGTDLKYKSAEQRKLLVIAEGTKADGGTVKVEVGTTGGDKTTIKIPGVSNKESLKKAAQEIISQKVYTGYEGSFKGWLLPYVEAGYEVEIRDKDYEYKNGTYYVLGVETEFSESGGSRKIAIGKKIK